jgi:hypothetical protein
VAELDVRSGATIHRSDLDCSAILVDGPRVFAACGRETIELDRSLTIVWRASAVGCTSNGEIAFASGLFFDGTRHLVTLYGCDRAALIRTVDTGAHTIVGEAIGPFSVDHSTSIWFHGAIVLGLSIAPGVGYEKQTLFVLSPDYARVEKTLDTGRGASIDDDGTNIRVSLSSEKAQSIRLFDHAVHATAWTRPRWLALDREIVLSDTLVAVSSRQLDATTHPAIPQTVTYSPTVAGGQRIIRQLDHGSVHLWLTQECCGGGRRVPPGLYAGRVDRPVKVEND